MQHWPPRYLDKNHYQAQNLDSSLKQRQKLMWLAWNYWDFREFLVLLGIPWKSGNDARHKIFVTLCASNSLWLNLFLRDAWRLGEDTIPPLSLYPPPPALPPPRPPHHLLLLCLSSFPPPLFLPLHPLLPRYLCHWSIMICPIAIFKKW